MRHSKDHSLKHPIPVIARRNAGWRNEYKAMCAISKRLEKTSAEEMIAAYLGFRRHKQLVMGVNQLIWFARRQEDDVEAVSPGANFIVQDRQLYLV